MTVVVLNTKTSKERLRINALAHFTMTFNVNAPTQWSLPVIKNRSHSITLFITDSTASTLSENCVIHFFGNRAANLRTRGWHVGPRARFLTRDSIISIQTIIFIAFKLDLTSQMGGSIEVLNTTSTDFWNLFTINVFASRRVNAPVSRSQTLQNRITKQQMTCNIKFMWAMNFNVRFKGMNKEMKLFLRFYVIFFS